MPNRSPEKNREAVRRHYHANKAKVQAKVKAYKKSQYPIRQAEVLEYLKSHPCVDCGEADPLVLEFDHRDQSEKLMEISRMMGISRKRMWEEVAKCDVRCCNCHRRKTRIQLGWGNR